MRTITIELEPWEFRALKKWAIRETRTPENLVRHLIARGIWDKIEADIKREQHITQKGRESAEEAA